MELWRILVVELIDQLSLFIDVRRSQADRYPEWLAWIVVLDHRGPAVEHLGWSVTKRTARRDASAGKTFWGNARLGAIRTARMAARTHDACVREVDDRSVERVRIMAFPGGCAPVNLKSDRLHRRRWLRRNREVITGGVSWLIGLAYRWQTSRESRCLMEADDNSGADTKVVLPVAGGVGECGVEVVSV